MAISDLELGDLDESRNGTPEQKLRARLVSVSVQLHVVADDGVTLHPIQVAPIQVSAAEWSTFSLEAQIADIQQQLH
jgi:hypothetical protein